MTRHNPRYLGLLGIAAALAVYAGIWLMHRLDSPPFLVSLPLGIFSQVFPNPWWVWAGTLVGLVGCGIAAYALSPFSDRPLAAPEPARQDSHAKWRPLLGIAAGLVGVGVFAYILSQARGHHAGVPVLLGLLAVPVLLTIAIDLLFPMRFPPVLALFQRVSLLDWGCILATAIAFVVLNERDAYNWRFAFIGDEWSFYGLAEFIARGNPVDMLGQAGVYGIHPYANSAYQALVMRIFGINVFGWRMAATLSVALPIAPLFWLARQFGDTLFAFAAAVFYAGCGLLWAFAHIGYNNNDPLLVVIPAAALLYAGIRDERASLLFACGAFAGLAWYTLFTGRLMIGVLGLVLLSEWQGGWRSTTRRLTFLLVGFGVVVTPLALDNGWDTIHQMFALVNLSQVRTTGPVSSLLAQNTVRGIFAFFYATEQTHYVVGEVFDALSATALALGCMIALRRVHDLWARLLLIWFLSGLLLTTPLYYAPQIADTRLQLAIPPAAMLAAFGLRAVARALREVVPWKPVYQIAIAGALVGALGLNGYRFYVTMPQSLNEDVVALDIGAIDAAPRQMILLAGDAANYNLCFLLDGYGKETGTILHFEHGQLRLLCPLSTTQVPAHLSSATVVVSDHGRQGIGQCRLPLARLASSPSRLQSIWGYSMAIQLKPSTSYMRRVRSRVIQACSLLPNLPPG